MAKRKDFLQKLFKDCNTPMIFSMILNYQFLQLFLPRG
jgi:hypothetical protein